MQKPGMESKSPVSGGLRALSRYRCDAIVVAAAPEDLVHHQHDPSHNAWIDNLRPSHDKALCGVCLELISLACDLSQSALDLSGATMQTYPFEGIVCIVYRHWKRKFGGATMLDADRYAAMVDHPVPAVILLLL